MTVIDNHDKLIKSSGMMEKRDGKKVSKKTKKCLTERVGHDKLIKSPKQGDEKFFEN